MHLIPHPARPLLAVALYASVLRAQTITPKMRWDAPLPAATAVGARADSEVTKMLLAFAPNERAHLQREFEAFTRDPRGLALEHVRSATYLAAGYDRLALLFAADAVRRDPSNGISVGNYGALLYAKDGPALAVETLRYANAIAPKTLAIVTTLGNVALALKDPVRARPFFESALRINGEAGEALLGMGVYWMQMGDPKSAFGYFARAGGVTYERKMEMTRPPVDGNGDPIVPPTPIEAPTASTASEGPGAGGGSAHPTGVDVEFPPSPDWATPDAFVAAKQSREHFAQWFADQRDEAFKRLRAALDHYASKSFPTGDEPGTTPAPPLGSDYVRGINDNWLSTRSKRALKDFSASIKPGLAAMANGQGATPVGGTPTGEFTAAALEAERANLAAAISKNCTDAHAALTGFWMALKPAQAKLFDDTNDLLKQYYKAQAGWIRTIDDPDLYAAAVAGRDAIVLNQYSALLLNEWGLRMAVALAIASGGTESSTTCPGQALPPPPSVPADPPHPELAAPPKLPCPFKDQPLDLSAKIKSIDVGFDFKLACDGVKYGVSGGPFSASRERIFHTKTIIDYKAEVEKSVSGQGATLSLKATGTVQIIRTDAGRETMTTGVELEGKAVISGLAEASITGGLTSTASDTFTPKKSAP